MKKLAFAGIGFGLIVSVFALTNASTFAVQAPVMAPVLKGAITRVDEREERERRCEWVRRECRERHGDHEREYRECVEREGCL